MINEFVCPYCDAIIEDEDEFFEHFCECDHDDRDEDENAPW